MIVINLFNLMATISLNDTNFTRGIQDSASKIENLKSGLGTANKTFGGVVGVLGGVGLAATKVGMDFESGMSQVAATMGIAANKSDKDFKKLSDAAKEMGANTKYSATQASEALNYLALAGYDSTKAVEALPDVLNLAAAGGLDLGYASDMVTDSMSALCMETNELTGFTDELAKTSQKSNTNIGQLGEAILTVGGTAKVLKGGTVELNTELGILADNGIKGAEGGTALRNMILSLSSPTDKAAALMKDLGLQVFDAEGNMRPMNETFKDLDGILGTMTQEEKTKVLSEIFNKVDLKAANALLANSGERFDELSGYISNSDGAASQMAKTMDDNLKGKLTLLGSALEGVGIAFYEKFQEPAKKAVEKVADFFSKFTEKLSSGELDNALSITAGALAGFGGALVALNLGMVIRDISLLIKGVEEFTAVTKLGAAAQALFNFVMALNPMTIIIAAIVGLVAALVTLWVTNEDFRNFWISVWENIKQFAIDTWNAIASFFTETIPSWIESFKAWWDGIPAWFGEMWTNVTSKVTEWGQNVWNYFVENIPKWIDSIKEWFQNIPKNVGFALGFALGEVIKWGVGVFNYLVENVPKWIQAIGDWFSELPGKIAEWLVNTFNKVVEWGTNMFNKAVEVGTNFVKGVIQWFQQLPGQISTWLTETISKIATWVTDMARKGAQGAKDTVTSVIDGFKQLPEKMANVGKNVVSGLWKGIVGMKDWIVGKVGDFMGGIVAGAQSALGIHSPSRVFRDSVGQWIPKGIAVGIDENMGVIDDIMNKDLNSIVRNSQNSFDGINGIPKASNTISLTVNSPKALNPYETNRLFTNELKKMGLQF